MTKKGSFGAPSRRNSSPTSAWRGVRGSGSIEASSAASGEGGAVAAPGAGGPPSGGTGGLAAGGAPKWLRRRRTGRTAGCRGAVRLRALRASAVPGAAALPACRPAVSRERRSRGWPAWAGSRAGRRCRRRRPRGPGRRLGGRDMDVYRPLVRRGEARQLEIVRREKREGAAALVQARRSPRRAPGRRRWRCRGPPRPSAPGTARSRRAGWRPPRSSRP